VHAYSSAPGRPPGARRRAPVRRGRSRRGGRNDRRVARASRYAGHPSHGIRLVGEYCDRCRSGRIDAAARPAVERDHGSTLVLDGRRAVGQIAAMVPVDLAVERAREHGVPIVAMCRGGHMGRLADYVERGAEAGMIVILAANDSGANQVVALHGSVEPRLATNPLAVGVASPEPPHLVLDMSTSVASRGAIEEARLAGHQIQRDVGPRQRGPASRRSKGNGARARRGGPGRHPQQRRLQRPDTCRRQPRRLFHRDRPITLAGRRCARGCGREHRPARAVGTASVIPSPGSGAGPRRARSQPRRAPATATASAQRCGTTSPAARAAGITTPAAIGEEAA